MQGLIPDFKPHHRLSAAKELLTHGFDAPIPDNVASPIIASPIVDAPVEVNNAARSAPPESPAKPESPPIRVIPGHDNRYKAAEHGPFYFETYDDADYDRDCQGDYALKHVLGSDEAITAATLAVMDLRREGSKVAIASGQDPKHSDHLGTVPADARQPKDIYGYLVLLRIYGSEPAARVAAKGAADYYREMARKSALNPDPPPVGPRSRYTHGTGPKTPQRCRRRSPTRPNPASPNPAYKCPGCP